MLGETEEKETNFAYFPPAFQSCYSVLLPAFNRRCVDHQAVDMVARKHPDSEQSWSGSDVIRY